MNEHPIWKLVRREFVTALILNHRARWKVGAVHFPTNGRTVSERKAESEGERKTERGGTVDESFAG